MELTKSDLKKDLSLSKRFPNPESAEALTSAFSTMISDGEALLKATTNYSAESLAVAREEFRNRLDQAKTKMRDVQSTIVERGDQATKVTRQYVTSHPLQSVAVAGGIGLLLGFLLRRNDE